MESMFYRFVITGKSGKYCTLIDGNDKMLYSAKYIFRFFKQGYGILDANGKFIGEAVRLNLFQEYFRAGYKSNNIGNFFDDIVISNDIWLKRINNKLGVVDRFLGLPVKYYIP